MGDCKKDEEAGFCIPPEMLEKYKAIESYGMIGNMHSCALVSIDGSIDWMCHPDFDSPSIFAAILDAEKGGRFSVAPAATECRARAKSKQMYLPDNNVLKTRYFQPSAVGHVIDFMPAGLEEEEYGYLSLIRIVQTVRGSMTYEMTCEPRFNYARSDHTVTLEDDHNAIFAVEDLQQEYQLYSSVPMTLCGQDEKRRGVTAEFRLSEGDHPVCLMFMPRSHQHRVTKDRCSQIDSLFKRTVRYWTQWLERCTYTGRWRETIHRCVLALKLLTYEPTGAIVAAPTTSLPEHVGGTRNFDYRYTWVRDSAFTLYAFMRVGFTTEAEKFIKFIEQRCRELKPGESLQIMYGIRGETEIPELILDHLEGYMGSRPVRIGNDAHTQFQLDIFGELLDSIYLYNKYGSPIGYDFWQIVRGLVDYVCDNWQRTDEGIWEARSGRQHYVYSKVLAWVAVDRGIRLAERRSFPANRARWIETRDAIYEEIMEKGWSEEKQSFIQRYGSDELDSSVLFMTLSLFTSPVDPRFISTIEAINRPKREGGLVTSSLVYRYEFNQFDDGFEGEEGTFSICTFWLIEALARASKTDNRYLEDARLKFEEAVGFANHVGLFSEEIGRGGEALGNFPQAFTHLACISAAYNLNRMLEGNRPLLQHPQ